ncbi:c-type cytochrome [Polynucleobacter asymbioticus]|jgi:cytochrome c553|uniref:Cytochrome c553-like protein n=1 Tax=Polynucleobacter asymbioticus (strain DSM 18221 / CIP 109841 / QLW-P1DMWA-1) TaxID=312153 RepID=A4SUZ3_POLAQ|nr:c-type cytochrome [Polynucleobacter asymbioticus]ABP33307.1 Cytochrome c553-like protein [Polynucleobacter asymbioticus QLW-P1DMWA-1]
MRQTSQISKFTSLRAGFAAISIFALTSISGLAIANDAPAAAPAAEAPAAEAKPVVPGKPKADPAAGEALYSAGDATRGVTACITCHGPKGQSAVGTWPKLSAQHAAYITKQLKNFKEGTRANAVMMGMAATLTEQDMINISSFLVKQPASQGVAQNKDTIELGQSIYRGGIASKAVPACAACHSPNGAGLPSQYPRLGGQWADYTYAQLVAFSNGTRKNGPMMTTIAGKMSDAEMKAVSDYIAGLH